MIHIRNKGKKAKNHIKLYKQYERNFKWRKSIEKTMSKTKKNKTLSNCV